MGKVLTPLRYPGGKQKLAPFISELLKANDLVGGEYVEPYAGGAGVAFELLLGNHVKKIHLNDSSIQISSFWRSVLSHTDELCRLVSSASLTVNEWKQCREVVRNPKGHTTLEIGFSTFYLNRCNRSGVLSAGLIGGLSQDGEWRMDARFPRNELIRRIEIIASRSSQITIKNWDAEKFMATHVAKLPANTLVYCDPPYYEKADRLYLNSYVDEDHQRLSKMIQNNLNHKWVVSYDNAPQIWKYYEKRRSFSYDLQYSAARVYKGKEVFIFSDDMRLPSESSLEYIDIAIKQNAGKLRMPKKAKAT